MDNICAIILAAGDGKRMKSEMPKVLSEVLFKPMIKWVIDSLQKVNIDDICIVSGYKHNELEKYLMSIDGHFLTTIQKERLGTAHAVITANDFLKKNIDKDVLVLNGDSPFIDSETINKSYTFHKSNRNSATVISAKIKNPFGYGRIIRNEENQLSKIVEQKDADKNTQLINEVNSGVYWFNVKSLLSVIFDISNNNAQNEFYLPDAISLLIKNDERVGAFSVDDENIIKGANDRVQLNQLNNIAREKVLLNLMRSGINIPFTDGIIIAEEVKLGDNVTIFPNSIIKGKSIIGNNCTIGPNVLLDNCVISDNSTVQFVNYKNYKN
ncbi:MAG: NTP transferase domain-containing protein [Clostridia bacterium]|nr:NTP transferase domain-containing protein [Clostridia bacterium]